MRVRLGWGWKTTRYSSSCVGDGWVLSIHSPIIEVGLYVRMLSRSSFVLVVPLSHGLLAFASQDCLGGNGGEHADNRADNIFYLNRDGIGWVA